MPLDDKGATCNASHKRSIKMDLDKLQQWWVETQQQQQVAQLQQQQQLIQTLGAQHQQLVSELGLQQQEQRQCLQQLTALFPSHSSMAVGGTMGPGGALMLLCLTKLGAEDNPEAFLVTIEQVASAASWAPTQ